MYINQPSVTKIKTADRVNLLDSARCKFNPILDGGGGGKFAPPAGFLNIAQKPLGLGS